MSETEHKKNSSKLHGTYITVIIILLIVIAGGAYYFHKNMQGARMGMGGANMMMRQGQGGKGMGGMMMQPGKPPALSDQQNQQLKEGTATDTTKKTFNISGGDFYFVPNKITVNKGDEVTFVMTNVGGMHDLVIDELGVKSPLIHTAEATTVTFTASKTGSFVYYCDVPGHKAKGMWGTLVVQ